MPPRRNVRRHGPGTPGMPHLQGFERSLAFDHGDNTPDKRAQYVYPTRLWRNGVLEHVPENEGPWDRGKFIAANGGVIVPFIAWCPGSVAVGETNRAVSAYDLKATFASLAGATMENETDGISFAPLFSGREDQVARRNFLYWEQGLLGENVQSALFDEQYFALRMQPDLPTELFDIFDDPGCKKNLADERHPLIERAETLFIEQHGKNPWYPNLTLALKK